MRPHRICQEAGPTGGPSSQIKARLKLFNCISSAGTSLQRKSEIEEVTMNFNDARDQRMRPSKMPGGLALNDAKEISGALTALLADMFALYVKAKNFHWHLTGPHFREYHRLLDDQAEQILATTDKIAERVRKLGATTLRSIGHIARLQRVQDNDAAYLTTHAMLAELCEDNIQLAMCLREAHGLCGVHGDVATAGLIENWVDEADGRVWSLFEVTHNGTHE
jgi:starvation-inducible DNA-binding protein